MHTETLAIALDGAREGHVDLDIGVGELRVSRTERAELLLEARIELPDNIELRQRNAVRDGVARCDLSADYEKWSLRVNRDKPRWDVRLGGSVPLQLDVKAGAAECGLDLRGIQLVDLDIESGVGETRVKFPGDGVTRARIKSGVGELVVTIPAALAARVRVQSGIGSVKIDRRFVKQGSGWVSAGYETASARLDLRIEAGVGSIAVRSSND